MGDETKVSTFQPMGERSYLSLMGDILESGDIRDDRTGTGTYSIFGRQMRFDLCNGTSFPMITTRYINFNIVAHELLWFIKGRTDVTDLQKHEIRIWNANSSREFLDTRGLTHLPEGDIGAGYGFQWRHFGAQYETCKSNYVNQGVDQLEQVVHLLRTDPFSRRICMTAWNPLALADMALPPCHSCFVQFYVDSCKGLSCHMYQRSVDCFLGLAYNIPSYALLTYILAAKCDLVPREIVISMGDAHVYTNHVNQVKEQLERKPLRPPQLRMRPDVKNKDWSELSVDDFQLINYEHHQSIRAPLAV